MVNSDKSTFRVYGLNQRASTDTQSLFASLEAFVNLGDSLREYQEFIASNRTFWPVEFRKNVTESEMHLIALPPPPLKLSDDAEERLGWGRSEDFHQLTLIFRDYLRRIWRGEQSAHGLQLLKILLGLEKQPSGDDSSAGEATYQAKFGGEAEKQRVFFQAGGRQFRELWESIEEHSRGVFSTAERFKGSSAIFRVQESHPGYFHVPSVISVDWGRGEFGYEPLNHFQRAVYALWRESWRARTCSHCARLFIAAKPPQLYCSVGCSTDARRKRDLALWHSNPDRRRRQARRIKMRRGKRGS